MNATGFRFHLLIAALCTLALVGCETVRPPEAKEAAVAISDAEKAEREGQYVLAAREYMRLAAATQPPQKQHFELRAAEMLIKAGQAQEARSLLRGINLRDVDPSFAARRRILEARLLSLEGAHEKAIRQLDEAAKARNLNPALMAELYAARAQAEVALDNPVGAARNLIARESLIVGKEAVEENQLQIWKILNAAPRARLHTERQLTGDPVLSGWIDLALIALDNAGSAARLNDALKQWRSANPKHPASESLIQIVAQPAPGIIGRIERIALLLPLSSPYAVAAEAVRDGFLAMDGAGTGADKPAVKIYDIGADPAKTAEFYQLALREGAQVVVGPLGRDAVDSLIRSNVVTVPTLVLSHTDDEAGAQLGQLFQFGLPPEQEARQAAERAYLDGRRQAAVLYPQSSWGERMMKAFVSTWQQLGGVIVASQPYQEADSDHSEAIKQMLNIHYSIARKERLEQVLRTKIPFESQHARPRQDVDAIFLAADAKRGRLLKPQLNFFQAGRIPVYATSHIYTGKADPLHDTDLDGVLFGDMPWILVNGGKVQQLRQTLQAGWPHAYSDLDRLYALGMDSYAVLPHLNRIGAGSGARFNGVTSGLSLDGGGHLQRSLTWARFSRGVPKLVDTTLQRPERLELDAPPGTSPSAPAGAPPGTAPGTAPGT